jgi:hypothetical protein
MKMKFLNRIACIIAACILTVLVGITILVLIAIIYCLVGPIRLTSLFGIDVTPWLLDSTILLLAGTGWGLAKMLRLKFKTCLRQYGVIVPFLCSLLILITGFLLADNLISWQLHPASRRHWLTNLSTLLYLVSLSRFLLLFRLEISSAFHRLFCTLDLIETFNEIIPTCELETATCLTATRDILIEFLKGDTTLPFAKVDMDFLSKLQVWMKTEKHLSDREVRLHFHHHRIAFAYAKEVHKLKLPFPLRRKQAPGRSTLS